VDANGIGGRFLRDLGGQPELLDLVEEPKPPIGLPSRLDAAGLLADSVALTTLALQQVQVARGQLEALPAVRLAGDRITTSAQSERHLRIDGVAPTMWSALSGFWRTSDGWVRAHGNYPHHAERLTRLLGLHPASSKEKVSAAMATRGALELEDAAAAAGAIVGAVRTPEEWAAHPHAAAVEGSPLVTVRHHAGAPPGSWTVETGRPLAGVRVLDLTRVIAGPTATRDLAFAGADVLRVDSPRLPEIAAQHLDTGQGKRSTRLDLASAADRRIFEDLLSLADVVVSGYRPGAMDRHGLSPEALWARRPGLVVGAISAWGESGPWHHKRGFDSIVQAVTGIAFVESPDGDHPGALPAQALDHAGGHLLAAALTHCLDRQRQDGGSWSVAISLARLAHALLSSRPVSPRATVIPPATLQTSTTDAGEITCAAPVLAYAGAPTEYPMLATAWGADAPMWQPRKGAVGSIEGCGACR
jgi:crotonobetainyl-CoA:carnitine CoA-transferase CaiB-like acyl-CoA transferase